MGVFLEDSVLEFAQGEKVCMGGHEGVGAVRCGAGHTAAGEVGVIAIGYLM